MLVVLSGLAVLCGKGDFLISGYNIADDEKKNKYLIKRLRKLVGGLALLSAAVVWMPDMLGKMDNEQFHYVVICILLIATIAVLVLANTWAKKK